MCNSISYEYKRGVCVNYDFRNEKSYKTQQFV